MADNNKEKIKYILEKIRELLKKFQEETDQGYHYIESEPIDGRDYLNWREVYNYLDEIENLNNK